jgi:predicted dehydrogenase
MSEIKFGVIGAGAIAWSSCKGINSNDSGKVIAATDLNSQRLSELCAEFNIENSYDSSDALLANNEIDAVYIAVPNKFHAPIALQALNAGKHVILDKPFAMNYEEAKEVADLAKAKGKMFMVGMNQRYRKDSQKIKSLVNDGVLGDVYHAKAYWFRRQGIPKLGTWFGDKELAGGGALLDIGVHLLDLMLHLIGNFEPISVSGKTYTKFGNRGLGEGGWGKSDKDANIKFDVDDFATAFIRLSNDVTVSLDVSWAIHTENDNKNNVEIFGTEGGAIAYPAKLFRVDPMRENYDVVEKPNADVPLSENRFDNFINSILGTEKPLCTVEESLVVQKILDGIYESCETGKEVFLDKGN